MRITLADEHSARAVVIALERYGYEAQRSGRTVLTDCPALLAVAVAERTVGLRRVAKAELGPLVDRPQTAGFGRIAG